jgi:hypothetical protein
MVLIGVRNPQLILNVGEVGIFSMALPEFHSITGKFSAFSANCTAAKQIKLILGAL